MKWFLIFTYAIWPKCDGIDCGINPLYRPTTHEIKIEMPSLDVCRQVRNVNKDSKCIGETVD